MSFFFCNTEKREYYERAIELYYIIIEIDSNPQKVHFFLSINISPFVCPTIAHRSSFSVKLGIVFSLDLEGRFFLGPNRVHFNFWGRIYVPGSN